MDQAEYDRQFKKAGIPIEEPSVDATETASINVDGSTVVPLRLTVINSSPQAMSDREQETLREHIQVVGRIEGGVELIRRTGGPDYAGNDAWRQLMRKVGRLR
jgi:hypothetical protein